jgi:hypothetical protein
VDGFQTLEVAPDGSREGILFDSRALEIEYALNVANILYLYILELGDLDLGNFR